MPKKQSTELSDEQILSILTAERAAAQGDGDKLSEERERAISYLFADVETGKFATDLPVVPGQSSASATEVSDAIETVLPDLIEIFTAGDDVVRFAPTNKEDVEQADQETDYVNHVFYNENDGWSILYTAIKDALVSKTGVFKWWWEETEEWGEHVSEDLTEAQWAVLRRKIKAGDAGLADQELDEVMPDEDTGLYTVRLRKKTVHASAKVAAVPPEDFQIDVGATCIRDATWACSASRLRAFDLIEAGFDESDVMLLEPFDKSDTPEKTARDTEKDHDDAAPVHDHDVLRRVEVREWHIWLDIDGDGKVECWRIVTGNEDGVLLDKSQITGIQYASICPYPITHKFYGRSLADMLLEVQRVKTALMRLMLNAYYFSVNPRPEVNMRGATNFTFSDLLDNKPGKPIRTAAPDAIKWNAPPDVGQTVPQILEYMSTVGEQRAGVVRNAQGLNPDTLHDTAKGAMELMNAAQRRTRMIARIMAESGIKDLFIGLHDLIVEHARKKATVRLRNKWVDVDTNKWGRRKDLTIEVGLGTSTKSAEQEFWQTVLAMQERAAGAGLADATNIFNAAKKFLESGNVKNPELYFLDPSEEENQGGETGENIDPEVLKVQQEAQIKREKAANDFQIERAKFQFETQLALYKAQLELGLAREAQATELRLKELSTLADIEIKGQSAAAKAANDKVKNVRLGGEIG